MNVRFGRAGLVATTVLLALPVLALAALPRGGTFTSMWADIHVAKGGGRILNADINCKFQSGVGATESIDFNTPIKIKRSGSFTFSGAATYLHFTGSGYKAHSTTASVRGKFVTRNHVKGMVTGGPGVCQLVSFTATYNPHAH